MSLTVNINQARELMIHLIHARLVPNLIGSPAIGKSSICHSIAEEYDLKVIDIRLAQCDPTDLLGFPNINRESYKAEYAPMSTFPLEGDELPKDCNGWLLFLDEFNSADRAVQKAAYKLILDRMIGEYKLHPKVAIICAGNLETDNAIVEEMSTALQSRLVHLELTVDQNIWIDWASENGIDHRITSFIKFKPGNLYSFNPNHTDRTYASPRTWEFANRIIKQMGLEDPLLPTALAGTISEGVAREFIGFCKIYKQLPTISDIIRQGDSINVPDEPSILYALTGSISHHANSDNIAELMAFVRRIPIEFQVVCLREIVRRSKILLRNPAITAWITENATELF